MDEPVLVKPPCEENLRFLLAYPSGTLQRLPLDREDKKRSPLSVVRPHISENSCHITAHHLGLERPIASLNPHPLSIPDLLHGRRYSVSRSCVEVALTSEDR